MGTRFWNCVGSQVHSDDEYGHVFFFKSAVGCICQQQSSSCSPVAEVLPLSKLGANPAASSGNGTSADDHRMQVDFLKKGKRKDRSENTS